MYSRPVKLVVTLGWIGLVLLALWVGSSPLAVLFGIVAAFSVIWLV